MALPDIILYNNQILLSQSNSKLGVIIDSNNCIYGEVVAINDLSSISIGDSLLFNPLNSISLIFDSNLYFLIDESKIIFKENM